MMENFRTASFLAKPVSKHQELYTAHERYVGKPPTAFEKFLYSWLGIAQIEEKLKEFEQLEELRSKTH